MFRKIFAAMMMFTVVFLYAIGTPASANQCTAVSGQAFIDAGQYKKAVQEFTCLIDAQPTEVEGYRGRIEAELLLGDYSDAVRDYARVTAVVEPIHPDAKITILNGYDARLAADPDNIPALTGKSFAQWWYFNYPQAIQTLHQLLDVQPDNAYGKLFRGSSRVLAGINKAKGIQDLEYAISLDPQNPHLRYVVSDAYTYGSPDPQRALAEATLALNGGLNTPRVQAILAAANNALGNQSTGAVHTKAHIDLVTSEMVTTTPIAPGATYHLDLVPGRTYQIPVQANAGETISIATSSKDFWDTILVLLGPDGTPVLGADDTNFYFAAIDWTAEQSGTYTLQVTSFESVSFGDLIVSRN